MRVPWPEAKVVDKGIGGMGSCSSACKCWEEDEGKEAASREEIEREMGSRRWGRWDRARGLSWRREGKNEREKGVGLGFRLGSGLREALGQMGLAGHKWRLGFSLPRLSFH